MDEASANVFGGEQDDEDGDRDGDNNDDEDEELDERNDFDPPEATAVAGSNAAQANANQSKRARDLKTKNSRPNGKRANLGNAITKFMGHMAEESKESSTTKLMEMMMQNQQQTMQMMMFCMMGNQRGNLGNPESFKSPMNMNAFAGPFSSHHRLPIIPTIPTPVHHSLVGRKEEWESEGMATFYFLYHRP